MELAHGWCRLSRFLKVGAVVMWPICKAERGLCPVTWGLLMVGEDCLGSSMSRVRPNGRRNHERRFRSNSGTMPRDLNKLAAVHSLNFETRFVGCYLHHRLCPCVDAFYPALETDANLTDLTAALRLVACARSAWHARRCNCALSPSNTVTTCAMSQLTCEAWCVHSHHRECLSAMCWPTVQRQS